MSRFELVWIPVLLVACGTRLAAVDARAVALQAQDCQDIAQKLADAGPTMAPERAEARACVCGALAVLRRAGQPAPDAGGGCP